MPSTGGIAYLCFYSTLIAFLLLAPCVKGSEETPREGKDKDDNDWFHFVTRPDIQVPKYEVHIYDKDAIAPGYWFVAPYADINKLKRGNPWEGPYIFNGDGELVWAGTPTMDYYMVNDFRITKFNNTDMITAIMFRDNAGLFFNNHYELVKSVSWTSAWEFANMHEFHVVRNSTRVLTVTRNRRTHLSLEESRTVGFEGNCSVAADGVMEVDITVDPPRVLFEWIGTDHIPLIDTYNNMMKEKQNSEKINELCNKDWDIHHFNSVDKFADGDYLISSKVLDTIFKVSHIDGSIVWRLGGRKSDFHMEKSVTFGNQHTPRIINETETHLTLSLFANSSPRRSRGMVIQVNLQDKTVELLQEALTLPKTLNVNSRGSAQLLPNGNMFTCWADWARISEHDANGKLLMFSHLKRNYMIKHENKMATYRAYKFEWVGRPTQPPDVYSAAFAAGTDNFVTRVFVSWNGATEVATWKFYESNADGSTLIGIEESKWKGFETGIRYEGYAKYVVVEALDNTDQAIGRSPVITTTPPVEGGPLALDQAATVLSCDTIKATGDSDGEFDTDYDYDGIINYDPYSYDSVDADADTDEFWIIHPIDPVSALAGFTTCATIWIAMTLGKRLSSQRRKGPKYEPLESKDSEFLFSGEGEDEEDQEEAGNETNNRNSRSIIAHVRPS